jgi:ParB family chromosome partitioning protein
MSDVIDRPGKPINGDPAPRAQARTAETWPIDNLKPHPRQAVLFGDMPDAELQALCHSIQSRGLDHPIEILPDGTIIKGHQRFRACKLLGWSEIPVVVRHDLAAQGDAAVEAELIQDNFDRRHLDDLTLARGIQRLLELERRLPKGRRASPQGDLRDRLAARQQTGKSGRTVSRLLQMLRTPVEVQQAYSTGKLTRAQVLQVERLSRAAQEDVAKAIRDGQEPADAVAQFVPTPDRRHRRPRQAVVAFVAALERGLKDLDGRLAQIRSIKTEERQTLERARLVIGQVLDLPQDSDRNPCRAATRPRGLAARAD